MLYGESLSRRHWEARFSRWDQVAGIRRFCLTEGPEAGVEVIEVRTGGGLTYHVTPSKGMDIARAEFAGVPIAWMSPNGEAHPGYYRSDGTGWAYSASGGLLMTCGLSNVGAPDARDERLGMHGRAHHLPARHISAEPIWK